MARNQQPTAEYTTSNIVVGSVSLSRFNWRLSIALFLGGVLWITPYVGSIAVVMPALVLDIAADDRVGLVGLMASIGAIVSLLSNILFGALSDVTRSRLGRRAPWLLAGSAGTALTMWGLSTASDATSLVLWWCAYMVALNAVVAPMVAVIADRVPEKYRGTVSSIYGVAIVLGQSLSQIIGAGFISDPRAGILLFAGIGLLSGVVFTLLAPDASSRGGEDRFDPKALVRSLKLPTRGARDFYLALFGKFALVAGTYAVGGYQLYILTDYVEVTPATAAGVIATMATIQLVTSLVFGFASGPISDRIGRRKVLVVLSALLIGVAVLVPFFLPTITGMLVYAVLAGIGNGVFSSVDQALNIEVLPDRDHAAKDLGILNMATTGGQMLGPVLTSVVVGISGGYQMLFLAAFVMIVLCAVLIQPIRKVR